MGHVRAETDTAFFRPVLEIPWISLSPGIAIRFFALAFRDRFFLPYFFFFFEHRNVLSNGDIDSQRDAYVR